MGRYRLLEHTADMGLEAWGKTRTELFIQAAFALREVLVGKSVPASESTVTIQVEGMDDAERLVNWLAELVFLFESRLFLSANITLDFAGEQLSAQITGQIIDPEQLLIEREVKAVTHHQVLVEETPQGWHGRVYLDL